MNQPANHGKLPGDFEPSLTMAQEPTAATAAELGESAKCRGFSKRFHPIPLSLKPGSPKNKYPLILKTTP